MCPIKTWLTVTVPFDANSRDACRVLYVYMSPIATLPAFLIPIPATSKYTTSQVTHKYISAFVSHTLQTVSMLQSDLLCNYIVLWLWSSPRQLFIYYVGCHACRQCDLSYRLFKVPASVTVLLAIFQFQFSFSCRKIFSYSFSFFNIFQFQLYFSSVFLTFSRRLSLIDLKETQRYNLVARLSTHGICCKNT